MTFSLSKVAALIAIFFLATLHLTAQDRVNKSLPVISDKVLWSAAPATGWIKSPDGQWLEGKNKIQRLMLNSTKVAEFDKGINALGHDNFISIEARDITIEGQSFILLTKKFHNAFYRYPSIKSGYTEVTNIAFAVFRKNTGKYDNSPYSQPNYTCPLFYFGVVKDSADFKTRIISNINEMSVKFPWIITSNGTDNSLYVYYKELEDKSKCRFFMVSTGFSTLDNRNNSLSKDVFTDYYFEAPTANYQGLINLIKPL